MAEYNIYNFAIILEIAFPAILAALYFARKNTRKYLAPVFGAITPLLLFYLFITFSYYFISREENAFAFGAMWLYSFFPYCVLVLIGLLVAACTRKINSNYKRYFIGLLVGPLTATLMNWGLHW